MTHSKAFWLGFCRGYIQVHAFAALLLTCGCAGTSPQQYVDKAGLYLNTAHALFLAQCQGDANRIEPLECVRQRELYDLLAGIYQEMAPQ